MLVRAGADVEVVVTLDKDQHVDLCSVAKGLKEGVLPKKSGKRSSNALGDANADRNRRETEGTDEARTDGKRGEDEERTAGNGRENEESTNANGRKSDGKGGENEERTDGDGGKADGKGGENEERTDGVAERDVESTSSRSRNGQR